MRFRPVISLLMMIIDRYWDVGIYLWGRDINSDYRVWLGVLFTSRGGWHLDLCCDSQYIFYSASFDLCQGRGLAQVLFFTLNALIV